MHVTLGSLAFYLWQIRTMAGKGVSASKTFSMKDRLFNAATVEQLAQGVARALPGFPVAAFSASVLAQFPQLELKACIECMADALVDYLPTDYSQATKVLEQSLPPRLDPTLSDDDFGHFIWAVPSEFAARHGCTADRLRASLGLLHAATQRFSAEFAIRPFLRDFPEETLTFLRNCVNDDNYHVRRLASEGIRPLLPWGLRLNLPTTDVLGILDALHADATRFVTRSVANNLNDVAKTQPDAVLAQLRDWQAQERQQSAELDWMTRHALRGLVKADHPQALLMLGYPTKPRFKLSQVVCAEQVKIGDTLDWSGSLTSQAAQKLKILLRVHYLKANGRHAAKVFALKDVELKKGGVLALNKKLPFKAMTTRALYPGEHHLELVVNGVARGKRSFALLEG